MDEDDELDDSGECHEWLDSGYYKEVDEICGPRELEETKRKFDKAVGKYR